MNWLVRGEAPIWLFADTFRQNSYTDRIVIMPHLTSLTYETLFAQTNLNTELFETGFFGKNVQNRPNFTRWNSRIITRKTVKMSRLFCLSLIFAVIYLKNRAISGALIKSRFEGESHFCLLKMKG